jgi:predicted nuclease of predicted toxin-antitoxin system
VRIFITVSRRILLRRKNVQTKVVEKIETHILRSITFFLEHRAVHVSVEICARAGQAIDENIKWRVHFAS